MVATRPGARVYVGCAGWSYDDWQGVFYPTRKPRGFDRLEYVSRFFDAVEINSTFYRMPRGNVCDSWRCRTPGDFCFAVKLNRLITHRKRLIDPAELLGAFCESVDLLGDKLGVILVQLPPRWKAAAGRLEDFLAMCRRGCRWAVEFRDSSWLCEEVFASLRRHNAALVVHDLIADHPRDVTADFVYLRFHGAGQKYGGCYSPQALSAAARRICGLLDDGLDVYAYFNNDAHGHAVRTARDLQRYVLGP